jgi:putative endonuclease
MHYVYILQLANGDLYKGMTGDYKRRISEHEAGKVSSTKSFRPFRIIGCEAYGFKSDAERREKFLKTTEGKRLIRQQYRDILARHGGIA